MKVIVVIPARYHSSRFPGKPLADICGKPMVWWVYKRAQGAKKVNDIVVATDDDRIAEALSHHDMPYVMTRKDHITSVNRVCEVAEKISGDYYVQLNGDEPLIDCEAIDAVIPDTVPDDVEFGTNIITEMKEPSEVNDVSNIKMVFDKDYRCLYMSRTPIPFPFKSICFDYYKHVGVIGYNKLMLQFYRNSIPGRFERIEGIDSLRFIDYGKFLRLIHVPNLLSLSVDTEMDLEKVREIIEKDGVLD